MEPGVPAMLFLRQSAFSIDSSMEVMTDALPRSL